MLDTMTLDGCVLLAGPPDAGEDSDSDDHTSESEEEDEFRDAVFEQEARAYSELYAREPDSSSTTPDDDGTDEAVSNEEAREHHGSGGVQEALHQSAATPLMRPVQSRRLGHPERLGDLSR